MRGPRARSVGWLACAVILLALIAPGSMAVGLVSGAPVTQALPLPAPARVSLQVPLAPTSAGLPTGALAPTQALTLDFSPQPASYTPINDLIAAQQDPSSPSYHHYLTPSEYTAMFDPSPAVVEAALAYFQSYGFTVHSDGMGLYELLGTAQEADRAFGTTLESYDDASGDLAYAPAAAPTLPSTVASVVGTVIGLNTFQEPTNDLAAPFTPTPASSLAAEQAGTLTKLSTSSIRPQAVTIDFQNGPGESWYSVYDGTTPIFVPPVGQNVTLEAVVTAATPTPVPNCTWTWDFGDGTTWSYSSTNCTTNFATHEYVQADNQFSTVENITVTFTDSTGAATGTFSAEVIPSMSSQWMQRFYNELQMVTGGQDGAGMTIGLDEVCDPSVPSPATYTALVNAYATAMGLPPLTVSYIGPGSGTCTGSEGVDGWSGETMLDMEWAHAMAPGAAEQVYFGVDGSAQNYADLAGGDEIWANDLTDNVFVASNSWGIIESSGFYSLYHNTWAQGAAEGLSFFASSGDCGSDAGQTSLNVEWPSSDPDGVGVGGTILQWLTNATYYQEYVWNGTVSNATCDNNLGTGGGWSCVYGAPSYQAVMPASDPGWDPPTTTTDCASGAQVLPPRGVPDVAADAATWADTDEGGEWLPVGGTSLASPMWAAMAAVILDAIGDGNAPAGLLDYPIYATGSGNVTYESDFHDVVSGNNCDLATGCTTYTATPLWDPASGWGGPNVANLTLHWSDGNLPTYQPVSGYVLNATGGIVAGATVTSTAGGIATSGANGYYFLYVRPGVSTLTASKTGYASSTVGIFVNATPLNDVNLTITWDSTWYNVVGTVVTQTGALVGDAVVTARNSVTQVAVASAATDGSGVFDMDLMNGTYSLVAAAPGFNDSDPATVTVLGADVTYILLTLDYHRSTVEGLVLTNSSYLPIGGATVQALSIQGGTFITSSATTSPAGQFFLHLPEGNASFTASALSYSPASVSHWVYTDGLSGLTLYLYPAGDRGNGVDLTLKVLDYHRDASGLPTLASGDSTTLEVWANNSLTGLPQLGIYLQFASTVPSATFSSDNVSVGSGLPGEGAAGWAEVNFSAPFLTGVASAVLSVGVLTPGWSGTAAAPIELVPNYAPCGSAACTYDVWGVVVTGSGVRLNGVSVQVTGGSAGANSVVTNGVGIYSLSLSNGSYFAQATLEGFYPAALTHFYVNGTSVEVDLTLAPIPAPLTPAEQKAYDAGGSLFSVDWWAIIPLAVLGLVVLVAAVFRLTGRDADGEDEKPSKPGAPPGPTPAEQIFDPAAAAAASPLPAGAAGAGALPAAPDAPPPESPWEITPAPPPPDTPPPDEGLGDDGSGDAPPDLPPGSGPNEPPAPPL